MASVLPIRQLSLLLVLAAAVTAQQPTPVFRTTTRLVELTVTALDKRGNPVSDLKREDFTLTESGKPQEITLFQSEDVPMTRGSGVPQPPGRFTNRVDLTGGTARGITALVLDSLNTTRVDNAQARAQVMRYLKTVTPVTRVAVYTLGNELRVLHDFTDDPDKLRERVEKAAVGIPAHDATQVSETIKEAEEFVRMFPDDPGLQRMLRGAIEADMVASATAQKVRVTTTLRAIETLGNHLAAIPGRKSLIWVSGGISMLLTTSRAGIENLEDEVRAVSQRLAQHGVTLHIVDARGLDPVRTVDNLERQPERGGGRFGDLAVMNDRNRDPDGTMQLMASITGGRYLKNTNDMAAGLAAAVADVRGSYTLGFYTNRDLDDKWHALKVRTKRDGVTLQYRQGWLAESNQAPAPDWKREDWQAAAAAPVQSTAILLKADARRAGNTIQVELFIDPENLAFRTADDKSAAALQVVMAEVNAGSVRMPSLQNVNARFDPGQLEKLRQTGIRYVSTWTPQTDAPTLRLIVRDRNSGRYGTLDLPRERIAGTPGM